VGTSPPLALHQRGAVASARLVVSTVWSAEPLQVTDALR
jgi:hypothetical protein